MAQIPFPYTAISPTAKGRSGGREKGKGKGGGKGETEMCHSTGLPRNYAARTWYQDGQREIPATRSYVVEAVTLLQEVPRAPHGGRVSVSPGAHAGCDTTVECLAT